MDIKTGTSGAIAGLTVDLVFFPLDTIKTRLQSSTRSGPIFAGAYKGIGSVLAGSMPQAALFFVTYETGKSLYGAQTLDGFMAAATGAEVTSCLVRVPMENVKQRMQVYQTSQSSWDTAADLYRRRGFTGFYKGYSATLIRDIPFACIEFPLYDILKQKAAPYITASGNVRDIAPPYMLALGGLCGAISAGATTPMDVLKTRIILSEHSKTEHLSWAQQARSLYATGGARAFWAGFVPRVNMTALGGALFLGTYDIVRSFLD